MTRARLIVALALALAGLSTTAEAASQLDGRYRIIAKIIDSNDGSRGDVRSRIYEFTPLCPNAICRKVALRREGPQARTSARSFAARARASKAPRETASTAVAPVAASP